MTTADDDPYYQCNQRAIVLASTWAAQAVLTMMAVQIWKGVADFRRIVEDERRIAFATGARRPC
ncbi:hypothetical protein BM221_005553 [Beauveria bassiana]|uniref:Uncharacterized protein n=1 Tax=Beauveria bassiana TaxID=176275 RepID=A0A2N6NNW3_BEABA|nr:hypothetical protein BM221_005553 [Beauveria bassiana]